MDSILFYLLAVCSVTLASFSQVLLKKSALLTHESLWKEYINVYTFFGYGMLSVSMVVSIIAYSGMQYKNGPMIESLGFVLVMVLSYFFFKEKITRRKAVGTAVILFGMMIFYL